MSCVTVNNKTASSIVTALVEMEHIHKSEAQSFLTLMMTANTFSVNNRHSGNYPELNYVFQEQNIGFSDEDENKSYRAVMQMIANIEFFEYQSFSYEDYKKSIVYKILKKLESELLYYFKSWCVQSGIYTYESIKDKLSDQLPFRRECSWGLDD